MSESIRGDVLTEARIDRKDVKMIPGERGGVEFRTFSYLDVLLEGDIITGSQYQLGKIFWTLKDCAFHELQCAVSRIEYRAEENDRLLEAVVDMGLADLNAATEIFRSVNKSLAKRYRDAIASTCQSLPSNYLPQRMWIIHAYGAGLLAAAFVELERIYPDARKDAEERLESACNAR